MRISDWSSDVCSSDLDINALVRETVGLVSYERCNQDFSIELALADSLPSVEADKIEVQKILLNLTRNSMEAMSKATPKLPRIAIRTALDGRGLVEVVVEDRGGGTAPEAPDPAFDPFFTTTPQGKTGTASVR